MHPIDIGRSANALSVKDDCMSQVTFEYIQQFRGQLRENSVGRKWWGAWKKLLSRFAGAAVKDFGVLEPEKGWDEQDNQTKISYGEDEYEGTFVDAVEYMEAVEV